MQNCAERKIKTLSLNVRGMISNSKRHKIFTWLSKQNADIIYLQETHCTKSHEYKYKRDWKGYSFYSHTNSAHSRGVGILITDKHNALRIINKYCDDDGRTIILNVEFEGHNLSLVNVYAPNDVKQRSRYYTELSKCMKDNVLYKNSIIVGGDFNCCIKDIDRSTMTHTNDTSRNTLCTVLNNHDLCTNIKFISYFTFHISHLELCKFV